MLGLERMLPPKNEKWDYRWLAITSNRTNLVLLGFVELLRAVNLPSFCKSFRKFAAIYCSLSD